MISTNIMKLTNGMMKNTIMDARKLMERTLCVVWPYLGTV